MTNNQFVARKFIGISRQNARNLLLNDPMAMVPHIIHTKSNNLYLKNNILVL